MSDDGTTAESGRATDATGTKGDGAKEGPALRADLNQLWKSTVSQFDEMKDILVRSGTAGKAKLEVTMLKRQQDKLFVELGAAVAKGRQAALDAGDGFELPNGIDADDIFARIDALQEDINDQQEAFDRLTTAEDTAQAPVDAEAQDAPKPEVVDAKDPPPAD